MKRMSEIMRTFRSIVNPPTDLQPAIDYFEVLESYVRQGFLEVIVPAGEAYITYSAMHTLACTDGILEKIKDMRANNNPSRVDLAEAGIRLREAFKPVARWIFLYSNFMYASDEGYRKYSQNREKAPNDTATQTSVNQAAENLLQLRDAHEIARRCIKKESFCIHVVGDERPHDLVFTIILDRRRRWWWPLRKTYSMKIINYRR